MPCARVRKRENKVMEKNRQSLGVTEQEKLDYYIKHYKIGWYQSGENTLVFIPFLDSEKIFEMQFTTAGRPWQSLVAKAISFYLNDRGEEI